MDAQQLINDGLAFASKAIHFDEIGDVKHAHFFYVEASEAILKAISIDSSMKNATSKALQYIERAEILKEKLENPNELRREASQTDAQKEVEQVEFLFTQAISEDEKGHRSEAISLYTDVVELCLQNMKSIHNQSIKEKINRWTKLALERAEELKGIDKTSRSTNHTEVRQSINNQQITNTNKMQVLNVHNTQTSPRQKLSKAEIDALKHTSYVNGKVYPPWLDVDLKEKFAYKIPFSDPDGMLALAPKQKHRLDKWARPSDLCENPQMIYAVSSFSIKQTIVSDCSFVASLAISAAYERQFQRKIITSIIYPQKKDGTPMINPCGKYMVKLHFNGVARKVIIDDYLPLGRDGQLLCSFSQNSDEFWVSLMEKAYMKVMGGYDFPGSNSNIDLHALTGWIPERASLKSKEINHDVLFDRLLKGLSTGDVLITAATGVMSDEDADRAGLVPTHAYAVLEMKRVLGLQLCRLKNPWSHREWKGNYSDSDNVNWTPELERALGFNREKAKANDNGVFWINWESLLRFYDVMYMSWNPGLFPFKLTYHAKWEAVEGPVKDAYNIGDNPQYKLEVNSDVDGNVVWLLLTRHITERDDFAENKEFITLHVFKGGKRIFYPENKFIEGTKINSPHYLCKIKPPKGQSKYVVALSQYEKMNSIYYSLKAFSTTKFKFSPVPEIYSSKKKITVSWTSTTAGGSPNQKTYENNPKIPLELISNTPSQVLIKIEASRKYAAGVELRSIDGNYTKLSGDYRWGFVVFELSDVPPGHYHVIPSTFLPGETGPFFLEVRATCAFKLNTR